MAPLIRRVLGALATSFPGRNGPVYGFNAGALYPAVFVRDFATVAEFAAFLFPPDFLRTPVEELLLTQEVLAAEPSLRGSVAATISPGGEVDKATAVSDEETSLIHAAYVNFRATGGSDWLRSFVAEKTVITRLNEAISYLQRERRDAATGLIWRAHTTDWGDVKLEGGPSPTDFIPGDAVIASIFDQALTYRAHLELQEMNAAVGAGEASQAHGDAARILRDTANLHLWDAARGRYRIHKNLTPVSLPINTDTIFALSNHLAVETGLANDEQVTRIFANTLNTSFRSGINRPGLTLWPPYPAGVFNHPGMESRRVSERRRMGLVGRPANSRRIPARRLQHRLRPSPYHRPPLAAHRPYLRVVPPSHQFRPGQPRLRRRRRRHGTRRHPRSVWHSDSPRPLRRQQPPLPPRR